MSETIKGEYYGTRGALFGLAVRTALLTAITIGIYRFWAKTRIRKYVWSSVAADHDSFEYTGTGMEKFLGFLMALVILAVYLGIIQMILFFFGLALLDAAAGPGQLFLQFGAFVVAFLAVVPLMLFAQYRARRYKLARTRWCGIRFGADPAAWGYARRAMGHWALSILTLGLLLPRQTFYLEKFVTDRSWYGDTKFHQGGKWGDLYVAMKHLFIALGMFIMAGMLALFGNHVFVGLLATLGVFWFLVGFVSYRVHSFAYLMGHKTLGYDIRFSAVLNTGAIVRKIIWGGFVIGLLTGIMFSALGGIVLLMMETAPVEVIILPVLAAYLLVFAVASSLMLVWITQPIIADVVARIEMHGAGALAEIRQRAGDSGTDAEGFADALDIGGAI